MGPTWLMRRMTVCRIMSEVSAPEIESHPLPHVDRYLQVGQQAGASDIHLGVAAPPIWRVHGILQPMWPDAPILTKEQTMSLAEAFMPEVYKEELNARGDSDFAYENDYGRYRVSVVRQRLGIEVIFRLINADVRTMDQLGLPEYLKLLTRYQNGLILVTGSVGSVKSTTLAAMIQQINMERHDHIITLEDPIEYVIASQNCHVSQREVFTHTESFGTALRSALREDPDVIMVGEMRDLETISLAITAAETGHLVFATLHTTDAPQTIDRVIDVFPPEQQAQIRMQLSVTLQAVISQTLLPRVDIGGRIAAFEVMVATPAIRALIREGKTHQLYTDIQTGGQHGMQSLDQHLLALLSERKISFEDALAKTSNPRDFEQRAARFRGE